jgi:hypothetical protein
MIARKNEIMFANAGVPARWGWSELLTKRAELDSAQSAEAQKYLTVGPGAGRVVAAPARCPRAVD